MHTPSLRRRVVWSGLGVFTGLLVALGVFVVLSLQASLEETLDHLLRDRAELALLLQRADGTEQLPQRLREAGIPAIVRDADGEVVGATQPAAPRQGAAPPARVAAVPSPRVSRVVTLPDGGEVEVVATRAGVDATIRRVLLLLTVGGVLALAVAALLLRRATAVAMAPLSSMVEVTRRTTEGARGQRMRPDEPTTELGQLAVAYDETLEAIEEALGQAEQSRERTRRFLDDAAHQLRTPIASIRASVETLLSSNDPDLQDRMMTNLVRETARASRLLRDLLTLARLDTGRPPNPSDVDLVTLCEDELSRARSLAPHLDVRLCTDGSSHEITVDAAGLQEALANLLDNARRHAASRVEVVVDVDEDVTRVAVIDDGPGVLPEGRDLIFDRFATLDGHGGSGLGLPIARSIARAHGGDLRYTGTGFVLTLPSTAAPTRH